MNASVRPKFAIIPNERLPLPDDKERFSNLIKDTKAAAEVLNRAAREMMVKYVRS